MSKWQSKIDNLHRAGTISDHVYTHMTTLLHVCDAAGLAPGGTCYVPDGEYAVIFVGDKSTAKVQTYGKKFWLAASHIHDQQPRKNWPTREQSWEFRIDEINVAVAWLIELLLQKDM